MAQENLKDKVWEGVVSYKATAEEVPAEKYFPLSLHTRVYSLTQDRHKDAFEESRIIKDVLGDIDVAVLLPGKEFDVSGTRHGHGGGWYDRFLSAVPEEWIRIGFCYKEQLSATPLVRESWDEPVDLLYVVDKESGDVTIHETHARLSA